MAPALQSHHAWLPPSQAKLQELLELIASKEAEVGALREELEAIEVDYARSAEEKAELRQKYEQRIRLVSCMGNQRQGLKCNAGG